nr:hypothetical protein [Variovorax paradoxus]
MFEVSNGTGSNASRSADIVLMNLWPSRGMDLIGYEVKTARSDWLRELKSPEKAWPVMQYMDRWFLLAAPGVAKLDEIPTNWGFQEFDGKRVRTLKPAPQLEPKPITKTFLGSLLRRQVRDADAIVSRALNDKIREVDQQVEAKVAKRLRERGDETQVLKDKIAVIKDKTGIDLLTYAPDEQIVHALKFAMLVEPDALVERAAGCHPSGRAGARASAGAQEGDQRGRHAVMLVLRPIGRGNWKPLIVAIEGQRAAPLLVRVGQVVPLGGVNFRISKVLP